MTTLLHEIIKSIRQRVFDLTIIPRTEYRVRHIHNKTNNPNTRNSNLRSNRIITRIGTSSLYPFLTDSCVHLNTARYVLSCSKYFEQLKTPCPCRRLSFPPKSENRPNLRCRFYDLDGSELFLNHSLAASMSLYFCFGCFGCSGYCSSIAPSSNAGRK